MKILSARAVSAKTSLSIAYIRRATKAGKFPKPLKLSNARMGWLESDINDWVSALIKSRHEGAENA